MKIGILQTGRVPAPLSGQFPEYPSMFARLLGGHGFTFETWAVLDGEFPPSVTSCDGWLITGSGHGAYDPLPWIPRLEEFIREAYAGGIPVAGICFGHQIMAQALGGKVEKYSGGWGVGTMEYRFTDGGSMRINAMHQDQVTEKPPEAEVICSSDFCRYAGLAYRDGAISFQPHPEFEDDYVRALVEMRAGKAIPSERARVALDSLDGKVDSKAMADQIAEFFVRSRRKAA